MLRYAPIIFLKFTLPNTEKKYEHTDKLEDRIGNRFVSSIVYGKARIRGLGKRQKTLNYACLMENDKKPLWGYIFSD